MKIFVVVEDSIYGGPHTFVVAAYDAEEAIKITGVMDGGPFETHVSYIADDPEFDTPDILWSSVK